MLIILTLLAINAIAVAFTPAHAIKITEICDQQFNYNAPVESKGTLGATGFTADGMNISSASYTGIGNVGQAYGLSGVSWQVSGNTFCNSTVMNPVTTGLANFLLSGLVSAASMFSTIIQVSMSSAVVQIILERTNLLSTIAFAVQNTFWAEWGTFITIMSLIVILWFFFRKGAKDGLPRLLWVSIAAALLTGSLTTSFLTDLGTGIQNVRGGISTAATATLLGDDCPAGELPAQECIASTVSSGVIDPVFNYGAAGDLAEVKPKWIVGHNDDALTTGQRKPGENVFYKEDSNMDWDAKKLKEVVLPATGVVPTVNGDGNPTVAEYMRWTQTYTAAETSAIKSGQIKGCSTLNAPAQGELAEKAGEELCFYKWQVRSALLYSMAGDTSVASYNAASGNQDFNYRIQPAMLALPSSGFALAGGSFIGWHMFFLQLEFIIQIIMVLFVFVLVMLKASPKPLMHWSGAVAMNTIKASLLGMMFGGLIILWNLVSELTSAAFTESGSYLSVMAATGGGYLMSAIMQGCLFGIGIIVLYVLYFKAVRKLAEGNPALASHNNNSMGAKLKGITNKSLAAGAAGVTTVATGGTMAAAAFAGTRAGSRASSDPNASMIQGVTSGITQGHRSGGKSAAKKAAKFSAQDRIAQAAASNSKMLGSFNNAEMEIGKANQFSKEADDYRTKAESAENDAATVQHQATLLEHKNDENFNDFAKETVEGQRLQDEIAATGQDLNRASTQTEAKQENLDAFLLSKGVTESHSRVTDPKTGNELTEVTDLSTGKVRMQDASTYNPQLEKGAIFTPAETDRYNTLSTKRDQAALYETEAKGQYTNAQRNYKEYVKDTRAEVLGMTNQQIDATYGSGVGKPEQGKVLRDWKSEQLQAQQLRASANSYSSQATVHRANERDAKRVATEHANRAQTYLHESNAHMRKADTFASPTTTAQRKMSNGYEKGDYVRQNAPRIEELQAKVRAAGATGAPVKVEMPVSASHPAPAQPLAAAPQGLPRPTPQPPQKVSAQKFTK